MKASEQFFTVILPIALFKDVLNFESVDKIIKSDNSTESERDCNILLCRLYVRPPVR